ncbi:MAG TPA: hypothetical protein VIH42_13485 [Thermoguttaceae bacterium]
MTDHDESLEIGIASGLDVPTAMVISEQGDKPPKPTGKGCYRMVAVLIGLAILVLGYLFL